MFRWGNKHHAASARGCWWRTLMSSRFLFELTMFPTLCKQIIKGCWRLINAVFCQSVPIIVNQWLFVLWRLAHLPTRTSYTNLSLDWEVTTRSQHQTQLSQSFNHMWMFVFVCLLFFFLRWTVWRKLYSAHRQTLTLPIWKSPYCWTTLAGHEVGFSPSHLCHQLVHSTALVALIAPCVSPVQDRSTRGPCCCRCCSASPLRCGCLCTTLRTWGGCCGCWSRSASTRPSESSISRSTCLTTASSSAGVLTLAVWLLVNMAVFTLCVWVQTQVLLLLDPALLSPLV